MLAVPVALSAVTTETLAMKFWERLEPRIRNGRLYSVTVGERDTNIVVYYGPNIPVPAPPTAAGAVPSSSR